LPYKEIIFYSANTDIGDVLRDSGVQGVYSTSRDDIPLVVEEIFLVLIKKVIDIEHSRGIAMGATSDIDGLVNECLVLIFNSVDKEISTSYFQQIFSRIDEIEKEFPKKISKAKQISLIDDLFKHHFVYTSNDRIRLLKTILKTEENNTSVDASIKNYIDEIVPLRNDLAHVNVKVDGFSRKIFTREGVELTPEAMRQLRIDLLKFRELMEQLKSRLTPSIEKDLSQ
jgi:hypothetical protein